MGPIRCKNRSAAVTTRGMKEKICSKSQNIYRALYDSSEDNLKRIKDEVKDFSKNLIYQEYERNI